MYMIGKTKKTLWIICAEKNMTYLMFYSRLDLEREKQ